MVGGEGVGMAECLNHPGMEATEVCGACAQAFCGACLTEVSGGRYCAACLARAGHVVPPPGTAPVAYVPPPGAFAPGGPAAGYPPGAYVPPPGAPYTGPGTYPGQPGVYPGQPPGGYPSQYAGPYPPPSGYYGAPEPGPPSATEQIIPARNPQALIGYYVSVFSLIPCFALLLGPAAIVLGYLGLKACRERTNMPGKVHAWVAIVLGSITSLVNWGVVIAAAIAAMTRS
jgi:hypothetical protein